MANALLSLCKPTPPGKVADVLIQRSRDDLAAVVGIAPELLSRSLSEFRHDGLPGVTSQASKLLQSEKLRCPHF